MSAYTTAVDILPPDEVVRTVDQYRRVYARHLFARVPVHITLSCPFVPFDRLQGAQEAITAVCAEVPPFSVRVAGSGHLGDPSRLVLFLEPRDAVRELQMLLLARFPEAGAEGLPGGLARPHITVGYIEDVDLLQRLGCELDEQARGLTFRVDAVHTTYGNEKNVWRVAHRFPLGCADDR